MFRGQLLELRGVFRGGEEPAEEAGPEVLQENGLGRLQGLRQGRGERGPVLNLLNIEKAIVPRTMRNFMSSFFNFNIKSLPHQSPNVMKRF